MNAKIIKKSISATVLILFFALPVMGAEKKVDRNDINADIQVLEERVKQNDEKTTLHLKSQRDELILRITGLEDRVNLYIKFAGLLFMIVTVLTFKTIVKWIKQSIEEKTGKYLTKEYVEGLIKVKGESAVTVLVDEWQKKVAEWLEEMKILRKDYEDILNNLRAKYIDVAKPLPEDTAKNLEEFAKKLTQTKKEERYSSEDWFFKGLKEYEEKDYLKAIATWTKAIELGPKNVVTYTNRGVAYGELKEYKKAIEDFNKAIELDPKFAVAYNNRGNAYSELKEYKKAIEDFNKAIELDPKYAAPYNNRGVAYSGLKDDKKAIEDFNKAIELDPKFAMAYTNRGNAYSRLKEYKKAIEDFNKAIELDPKFAGSYNNRGVAYGGLKDDKKAIEDFNKAIELDPKFAMAYLNLSERYIICGKFKDALDVITTALPLTTNKEDQAVALYLDSIVKKLLNIDSSAAEAKLDEILKEELALTWSFEDIEEWLKVADIKEEDKKYLLKLTELIKRKKI